MIGFDLLKHIIGDYIRDILYVSGAIATFFVGKRVRTLNAKKQEVDIERSELDNVEAALKIYRTMLNDLQTKLKEAEEAYGMLEARFTAAIEKNQVLIAENEQLKRQINETKSNR